MRCMYVCQRWFRRYAGLLLIAVALLGFLSLRFGDEDAEDEQQSSHPVPVFKQLHISPQPPHEIVVLKRTTLAQSDNKPKSFVMQLQQDINTNNNMSKSYMKNLIVKRQEERQKRISDFCAAHGGVIRKYVSKNWSYKLNKKFKYLLCPIPKCGWSSWKRLWFYTAGVISSYDEDIGIRGDKEAGVFDLRRNKIAEAYRNKLYSYSFTFARNPWDRLVSAYINKAVDYNYTRVLHAPCKWEKMVPYKEDLTFEQFLTCISEQQKDMHWIPQWRLCDLCGIKYDFIGHLDTVNEDAQYVIDSLGLNLTYPHAFPSKAYKGLSLEHWYKDLPVALLKKLQQVYLYDFELHGFDKSPPGRSDL